MRPVVAGGARVAAAGAGTAAVRAPPPLHDAMAPDHFEVEALLTMATVAPRDLVKALMDIEWARDVDGKLAQIDARLTAIRDVEETVRQRIFENPALTGKPLPPVPPPAVLREFTVVMAARTASDKLTATRAALAGKR